MDAATQIKQAPNHRIEGDSPGKKRCDNLVHQNWPLFWGCRRDIHAKCIQFEFNINSINRSQLGLQSAWPVFVVVVTTYQLNLIWSETTAATWSTSGFFQCFFVPVVECFLVTTLVDNINGTEKWRRRRWWKNESFFFLFFLISIEKLEEIRRIRQRRRVSLKVKLLSFFQSVFLIFFHKLTN